MRWIDRHKRGIALVVAFAFFYLIHVSAAPLPAAPAAPVTKTAVSSDTDQPGAVEHLAPADIKPKKNSPIVGIVIAIVLISAIAAVLILVVFKTKYDITGPWTLSWNYPGHSSGSDTITFTGTKKAGSFTIGNSFGTYTVDGQNVSWTYAIRSTTYTGKFTGKKTMSGTAFSDGIPGTWTATRTATDGSGNEKNFQDKNSGKAK